MTKIYFKKHERIVDGQSGPVVLALCDAELIGKKLSQGKLLLDLDAYRSFYAGELVTAVEAARLVKKCFSETATTSTSARQSISLNLVGKNSLKAAASYVDVKKAKLIGKVPHLQVYRV